MQAAAGVRVGHSYLIGARRAPTRLRGTSESLKGERDLDRPQGLPKHGLGQLVEPHRDADIAKSAISHVTKF